MLILDIMYWLYMVVQIVRPYRITINPVLFVKSYHYEIHQSNENFNVAKMAVRGSEIDYVKLKQSVWK